MIFQLSSKITLLPVIYGSGDFALEVRRRFQAGDYDCLAVPLPPAFEDGVLEAVDMLPRIHVVAQREGGVSEDPQAHTIVPIDPCQPVIAAIREARNSDVPCEFIDLEVQSFDTRTNVYPDPFALKEVSLEKFAAALVTTFSAPEEDGQQDARIRWMANQLHLLELDYERVLCICAAQDWAWIRDAYQRRLPPPKPDGPVWPAEVFHVETNQLYFVLGELPFVTYLYEHQRAEAMSDASLAIDGVKTLILETRSRWLAKHQLKTHWLTPQTLSVMLTYIRNLTLIDSRMSPDLYTLGLAAKQVGGDDFAAHLIETSRDYPPQSMPSPHPAISLGMDMGVFPVGDTDVKNRLIGTERVWRELPLRPTPPQDKRESWKMQWDPNKQCSYPPEDDRIESFNSHVREQAKLLIGEDLAKTEKFTSSLKDGLDIRETLRNWHTGDIYVREMPPSRGNVEIVVFLFDTPADPNRYDWRTTWYAEHNEESTLCFYAEDFHRNAVGPGIAESLYGGLFLLFPPRPIPDVWTDPRFDAAESLEERLIMGAALHSKEKRVVVVSPEPPRPQWRRTARNLKRTLVHIPLKRFSMQAIDRMRRFHVLNGREVRSYAAKYIRDFR